MIKIKKFIFNPFQVNCFVLYAENDDCYLIDPSCQSENEIKIIEDFLHENRLNLKGILNSHGHVDHLPGVKFFREKYNVPFYLGIEDEFLIHSAVQHGIIFGFHIEPPPVPDRHLQETLELDLGDGKIRMFHVPGHSPGSYVFYLEKEKVLITGDVLFNMSIGRTDLPGGDYHQLINGIKEKLLVLDGDTKVFPGHGTATSIGNEKKNNPFLQ